MNKEINLSEFITRNKLLLLGLAAVVAAVLDLLFYTGFYGSDDKSYILFAHELANGSIPLSPGEFGEFLSSTGQTIDFGALRFAYTLPLSLVYLISGGSIFSLTLLNVLIHIGIVIVTYKLGEMYSNSTVGLFAAIVVTVSPVFYIYTGMILPDNSEVFWLLLSLLCLLKAKYTGNCGVGKYRQNQNKQLFLSGLFIGLSYSSKLSALIMFVPFGIYLLTIPEKLFSKETIKVVSSFAIGFAIIVLIETVLIYLIFDTTLTRYEIIAGFKDHYLRRAGQQGTTVAERYRRMWQIFGVHFSDFTIYFAIFITIWFPFLVRKNYLIWYVLVWGVLYKTFGTTNFATYAPPVIQVRYFAFSVPLLGIMSGISFVTIYQLLKVFIKSDKVLKVSFIIIIAGIFSAITLLNIDKNLPSAGKLYRTPLVQSTENAINYVNETSPESPVALSGTCSYWLYPIYFLEDNSFGFNNIVYDIGKHIDGPFYIVGSVTEDLNKEWFKSLKTRYGESSSIKLVDIFHPDPPVIKQLRYALFGDDNSDKYMNETFYNRYRSFVIKVDPASSSAIPDSIGIIPEYYLLLYHRTVYPDVRVFKEHNSHLITWNSFNEDREIFINSFDNNLQSSPPDNRLLGSLDSTALSYDFEFNLFNDSGNSLRVTSAVYTYNKQSRLEKIKKTVNVNAHDSVEVKLKLDNKSGDAENYRLQLFILNKSGEDGKLIVDDFNVTNIYK